MMHVVIASPPKLQAFKDLTYGIKGKLCTVELLSTAKINSFASMRKEVLGMLVQSQQEMAAALEVVDITTKVADVIDDMTYRMVFGCNKDRMDDLKTLVNPCSREHQVGRNLKNRKKIRQ